MSKLGDILQDEALEEIAGILSDADSRAVMLIEEARKKASARLAAHQRRTEAEARAAARRAESAAELTVATARRQARGLVMAQVREKALAALNDLTGKPGYPAVLQALAEEAMKATQGPKAAVVHPGDKALLSGWATEKGLELRTDSGLRLGVRIASGDGKRSVENSLPERLERAWDMLASQLEKILWE
jgi:V/A-type H+/Na+-transporting ATPase subunit E